MKHHGPFGRMIGRSGQAPCTAGSGSRPAGTVPYTSGSPVMSSSGSTARPELLRYSPADRGRLAGMVESASARVRGVITSAPVRALVSDGHGWHCCSSPQKPRLRAHDLLHDLGRAAVEPLHPGVSPEPGDLVLVDVAVAAVQLQAAVHDFPLQFGGPPLGPGRLHAPVQVGVRDI